MIILKHILTLSLATFAPPDGWRAQDPTALKCSEVSFIAKKTRGFNPSINLAIEPTSSSLEAYTEKAVKMHKMHKHAQCERMGKLQALSGEGNLLRIERELPWGKVELMQFLQITDGKAYILTAAAKKEIFPTIRSEIISSFRSLELFDDFLTSAGRKSYPLKTLIQETKKKIILPKNPNIPIVVPRLKKVEKFCAKELPEKGQYWHALLLQSIAKEILDEKIHP